MTQTSHREHPRRTPGPGHHRGQDSDGHGVDVAVCTEQGTRRVNADAVAERRARPTGRTAVAVADGVGDTGEAGWAASVALRAHGIRPAAEWEHVLTVTVRTATAGSVGRASLRAPRWLLLVTDGVHRALGDDRIHAALRTGRTAQDKAESLRRALAEVVLHDNATAIVVSCGTDPRSLRPRPAAAGRAG